ncbi:hypothetical protein ACFOD4_21180 [Pseudoroseomonas globiformis]|uniref:Uncharacterized protein n=1 Tax=Teichococcus globiformis TaxID=2307229 RepID=A0ABV7G8M8_9PROT
MTQTHANVCVQVEAVLARPALTEEDRQAATQTALQLVMLGCGLATPSSPGTGPSSRRTA